MIHEKRKTSLVKAILTTDSTQHTKTDNGNHNLSITSMLPITVNDSYFVYCHFEVVYSYFVIVCERLLLLR